MRERGGMRGKQQQVLRRISADYKLKPGAGNWERWAWEWHAQRHQVVGVHGQVWGGLTGPAQPPEMIGADDVGRLGTGQRTCRCESVRARVQCANAAARVGGLGGFGGLAALGFGVWRATEVDGTWPSAAVKYYSALCTAHLRNKSRTGKGTARRAARRDGQTTELPSSKRGSR